MGLRHALASHLRSHTNQILPAVILMTSCVTGISKSKDTALPHCAVGTSHYHRLRASNAEDTTYMAPGRSHAESSDSQRSGTDLQLPMSSAAQQNIMNWPPQ
jgi:hypothetical protein